MTQLVPLTTVLVVAGTGSTAICADLGARTIREEIDALETLNHYAGLFPTDLDDVAVLLDAAAREAIGD